MRPYYLQPGDCVYQGLRLPYGVEVHDVHVSELTAAQRKAFGLPALLTGNDDLVPCQRTVERAA